MSFIKICERALSSKFTKFANHVRLVVVAEVERRIKETGRLRMFDPANHILKPHNACEGLRRQPYIAMKSAFEGPLTQAREGTEFRDRYLPASISDGS